MRIEPGVQLRECPRLEFASDVLEHEHAAQEHKTIMTILTIKVRRRRDSARASGSLDSVWPLHWPVRSSPHALAPSPPHPLAHRRPARRGHGRAPELSGADVLEKVWPGHPEWLAMLADIIIKGDRLQGTDGWFRKDHPQTRFPWPSARTAWDKDGNGSVSRAEFPGTDGDFARLDRDHNGALEPSDFDFSTRNSNFVPGSLVFGRADLDGNGKVTPAEFSEFFRSVDRDGAGFLSLSDLQQALEAPPPMLRGSPGGPDGPTRATLLKSLLTGELGGMVPGPALNATAPDFTLRTPDGRREVTLSKIAGPKPVVLVFGNYTCRPFRGQGGNLEKLYARYKDRATFLAIYIREAHPTDGWRMEVNDVLGVSIAQPRSYAERARVAQVCSTSLGLGFPMLVDTLDDAVNKTYCGIPSRLYLIDSERKIAYKSGRGPFGFKPAELEQSLVMLLEQDTTGTSSTAKQPSPAAASPALRERGGSVSARRRD